MRVAFQGISEARFAHSLDLAASCLRESRLALERFLGMNADDDLLDTIFRQFCLGK